MPRLFTHAASIVVSALLFLPLWSAMARGDVSWGLKLLIGAVWIAASALPSHGTLVFAFVLPLGLFWAQLFGGLTPTAVSECLTLAFASGAALRFLFPAPGVRDVLSRPAAVLGAIVVTRSLVDVLALRAVAPGRPFWAELGHHVRFLYWTEDAGNWLVVHDTVRWIAVLVVAIVVERSIRSRARLLPAATWVWIGATAAATSFTFIRVAEILTRRDTGIVESLGWLFSTARLSVLHPDPNAAGSIFAWLIIAGLVIGARRRMWWLLAIACPMLVVAFLLAQSRSAVGAMALVVLARWLVPTLEKRSTWWPALGAVVVIAVVTVWMVASRSHIEPSQALSLRYEMARVGLRMAAAYPLYGVGVGDYARTSRRFLTPDQEALAVFARQGENAHNNFLQVIVEFGIPGGLAFVWLVCPAAIAAWRPSRPSLSPEYQGLALGLSAFLVSALLGHPLLIPEVAAMFFLGLGLTAASLDGPDEVSGRRQSLFAWGAVVFFVLSLFWRLG